MRQRKRSRASLAVVTGAGSGIGRAFAMELAQRGGRVVCSDIVLERAEETARLIHDKGGDALALATDVSRISQMEALAKQAESWFE